MNAQHTAEESIVTALRAADFIIAYTPIGDEPDAVGFLRENGVVAAIAHIPPTREEDPAVFAAAFVTAHAGEKVCILVPGREFDTHGTRHGRGGGWYDRFLSAVPREWLRIGVLDAPRLSEKMLAREAWDEPMDALLVKDGSSWKTREVER